MLTKARPTRYDPFIISHYVAYPIVVECLVYHVHLDFGPRDVGAVDEAQAPPLSILVVKAHSLGCLHGAFVILTQKKKKAHQFLM